MHNAPLGHAKVVCFGLSFVAFTDWWHNLNQSTIRSAISLFLAFELGRTSYYLFAKKYYFMLKRKTNSSSGLRMLLAPLYKSFILGDYFQLIDWDMLWEHSLTYKIWRLANQPSAPIIKG